MFSCEVCEILKKTYFYRTPLVVAPDYFRKTPSILFFLHETKIKNRKTEKVSIDIYDSTVKNNSIAVT